MNAWLEGLAAIHKKYNILRKGKDFPILDKEWKEINKFTQQFIIENEKIQRKTNPGGSNEHQSTTQ